MEAHLPSKSGMSQAEIYDLLNNFDLSNNLSYAVNTTNVDKSPKLGDAYGAQYPADSMVTNQTPLDYTHVSYSRNYNKYGNLNSVNLEVKPPHNHIKSMQSTADHLQSAYMSGQAFSSTRYETNRHSHVYSPHHDTTTIQHSLDRGVNLDYHSSGPLKSKHIHYQSARHAGIGFGSSMPFHVATQRVSRSHDSTVYNHNVDSSTVELVVRHTVEILSETASHCLKSVELANTLRDRVGEKAMSHVKMAYGGLLVLLEVFPRIFQVMRSPKNDYVKFCSRPSIGLYERVRPPRQCKRWLLY